MNPARRNAILLVVLLAFQLLVASASVRRSSRAAVAESWMMSLSSPLVGFAGTISGLAGGAAGEVRDLLGAHSRNAALDADVRRLSGELVRSREALEENRRLRRLLGMRNELVPESVAATVVTSNLDGQTRMIVIDRGTADGIEADMPVVAWGGAVGKVLIAERGRAKVRLLNDLDSGVLGAVQRSRVRGVVQGRPDSKLDMLYVPRFSDLMHGDRIVTSGLDGIFPRGFGIGRVSAITEHRNGTQTIHLEPEIDYASLEEVLVLLGPPNAGLLEPPDARDSPGFEDGSEASGAAGEGP